MTLLAQSPLGRATAYAQSYDASLLFAIARREKRAELGITAAIPFMGADLWTAFELSWLNLRGKPQVALAHFTVPCETPNMIESKSLKLYLNSFNNTRFEHLEEVRDRLRCDLSELVWRDTSVHGRAQAHHPSAAAVGVKILPSEAFARERLCELDGVDIDRLDVECTHFTLTPELLRVEEGATVVSEVLSSKLLKSNCLVTGQPDWASVQISYTGAPIDQEGLLRYLVSFRNHNEFHEQCVERIFMDVWTRCSPLKLSVYARYTRRGGLDINPFRTSHPQALPEHIRTARQ